MTVEGASAVMSRLAAMECQAALDKAKVISYTEALEHIPDEIAITAVKRMRALSNWRPSEAALLGACLDVIEPCPNEVEALKSIQAMKTARRRQGGLHPVLKDVIDAMGGFRAMASMEEDRFYRIFSSLYNTAYKSWHDAGRIALTEGTLQITGTRNLNQIGAKR